MREILFRGKGIHTGKWFFGSLVEAEKLDNSKRMEFFIIEKSADGATHAVKPETVGQYTGMKDKNGKPIFEGDILEAHYDEEHPESVVYSTVFWGEYGWCIDEIGFVGTADLDWFALEYNKVAGNIYDNPELIEE